MAHTQEATNVTVRESKYTVRELPDGFTIDASDRPRVTVTLHPTYLSVDWQYAGELRPRFHDIDRHRISPLHYNGLLQSVARGLMRDWEPPEGRSKWRDARGWAVIQTRGAIGKRVHQQWQRFLAQVDPKVVAVHRAVYAATLRVGGLAFCEALYEHDYIVNDVTNYRAAAVWGPRITAAGDHDFLGTTLHSHVSTLILHQLYSLEVFRAEKGEHL